MSLRLERPTNLPAASTDSMFASPKRKRACGDVLDLAPAPSPTRLRTSNLPPCSAVADEVLDGDRSPRSTVAGRFQNLNLTGSCFEFGKTAERPMSSSSTIADSEASEPPSSQESFPSSTSQPHTSNALGTELPLSSSVAKPKDLPLEIPETPRLQPTTVISPNPSPIPRAKSPPPLNLWWADTEITGHAPTDPADDGYGINGVGFIPTPAMASARAERRKRQVAEWKNREAREARQRRSEARRRRDYAMSSESLHASEASLSGDQQRRVRFLEV